MQRPNVSQLVEMLSYARPAGSRTEERFIKRYIAPTGAKPDAYGNYILRIGDSRVLWSSHTDTVHRLHGRVAVDVVNRTTYGKNGEVKRVRREAMTTGSNCLGADDTTGVWLMLHMIAAQVPGLYVFHRAEETGCNGSNYIATETPELLDGIDYAIAFDRKGTGSIITHQIGAQTASDEFAWHMAAAIGIDTYMPDDGGVFTDTLEYAGLVSECTNISVGYMHQHTDREVQDLDFAEQLAIAMMQFDERVLHAYRTPQDVWAWHGDSKADSTGYHLNWAKGSTSAKRKPSDDYEANPWEDATIVCEMCGRETEWGWALGKYDVCKTCFYDLTGDKRNAS
jgi:hypothetical protein